jgi:branched-chain amino acid transport system permease protein
LLTAAVERLGVNAPGAKALFYGLTLMGIIFVRPDGVWPWLARVCGLASRRGGAPP